MSRDDGVYVLKTKDQYRVTCTQAIEDVFEDYRSEKLNPINVVKFWNSTRYTRSFETAMKIANIIENREHTEYGIRLFEYNKTWKHIIEDAKTKAKEELVKNKNNTGLYYKYLNEICQQILDM